jgi:hypothetical protein
MSGIQTRSTSASSSSKRNRSRSPSSPEKSKKNYKKVKPIAKNLAPKDKMEANNINEQLAWLINNQKMVNEKIDKIDLVLSKQIEMESKLDNLTSEINNIKSKTENLEKQAQISCKDIEKMKVDLINTTEHINELQQLSLANKFSIKGIPADLKKEKILDTIKNFGNQIGEQIDESDLENFYIQKYKNNNGASINGSFFDIRKKQKVFNSFKAKKPVIAEDICELPVDSRMRGKEITIRNQLTNQKRSLLHEAKILGSKFRYVWENNGRILMKYNENSSVIEIKSYQQLINITKSET